ncbi:MAG: recombination mediator RecR [Pseudomonadota bacterium]
MFNIPTLDKLVHEISRLPGVGSKSAQRLTQYILKNPEYSQELRKTLKTVEENIRFCQSCFNYTDHEDEICHICRSPHRNPSLLCVVEQPEDINQIEASGAFTGLYHVLHGAISPLEGITPDKLKIAELFSRIDRSDTPVQEVILAVDSDLEGDTTVLYLNQQFEGRDIKITRLAQGIPMGSDINYIDDRTMHRALSYRTEV